MSGAGFPWTRWRCGRFVMRGSRRRARGLADEELRLPAGELALGLLGGDRIGFLHALRQVFAVAAHAMELLLGEPVPAALGGDLVLVPLGLDRAPAHGFLAGFFASQFTRLRQALSRGRCGTVGATGAAGA